MYSSVEDYGTKVAKKKLSIYTLRSCKGMVKLNPIKVLLF